MAGILLSLIPFHWRSFFMGPTAIHLWAAADWYALALGFIDNGLDFFHPQVNQLNLQFPGNLSPEQWQGITAVDFPVNPYLVACGMKSLNTTSPMVYRGYTLVLSLIGLYFLMKAVEVHTGKFVWAVFVVSLVRFQPAFAYYMDGFMPTQNALSVFFVGLYFFARYRHHPKNGQLFAGMLMLTLAALMRLPFVIPIVALAATYFLAGFRQRNWSWSLGLCLLGAFGLIGGYYLYNRHLASTFGSVFLNELMPLRNLRDFVFFWLGGIARNSQSVFPVLYVGISLFLGWKVFQYFRQTKLTEQQKVYILYIGILFTGVLMYSILMGRQLWAHDYYFNDFFLPAFLIALILLLPYVDIPSSFRKILVALFVLAAFQSALLWQKYAYNVGFSSRPAINTTRNFEGAAQFLDSEGVAGDAALLVIGSYAPSVPGNATRRPCFGVRIPKQAEIEAALQWPFDYMLVQNEFYGEVVAAFPDWEQVAQPVASNGKLTLYTLKLAQ